MTRRGNKRLRALLLPSVLLQQRYMLQQSVCKQGRWAVVFRGWDVQGGQAVTIKRAHWQPECVAALWREAHLLSLLKHPVIPAGIDAFEEEGQTYFVEEWRPGLPLDEQDLSVEQVCHLGRVLTAAVSALHALGIYHGDLSSANVLLEQSTVSLVNFGLASTISDPQRVWGAQGYAAPEQWAQGIFPIKGEVYNLAMVLGCALTKSPPRDVVRAGSFSRLWDAHSSWEVPQELAGLLTLLDRAIAPDATARPDVLALQEAFAEERTPL